jgi:hypothetical protein
MPTNVTGDQARLFPWQMEHYIQHGGPNDPSPLPTTQGTPTALFTGVSAAGTADGCYLSAWKTTGAGVTSLNSITVPPVPGSPYGTGYIPLPRSQYMFGGTGGGSFAPGLTSVTTNAGGVYIGTIPQGAWVDSVDLYIYAAFSGNNGVCYDVGVFYCQAQAYNSNNSPGYQPATVYPLAFVTGTAAGANTLFSTETGLASAFTSTNLANLGPGNGQSAFTTGSLASIGDIDLYFIAFCSGTATTYLATGSAAVRIKFTGLPG